MDPPLFFPATSAGSALGFCLPATFGSSATSARRSGPRQRRLFRWRNRWRKWPLVAMKTRKNHGNDREQPGKTMGNWWKCGIFLQNLGKSRLMFENEWVGPGNNRSAKVPTHSVCQNWVTPFVYQNDLEFSFLQPAISTLYHNVLWCAKTFRSTGQQSRATFACIIQIVLSLSKCKFVLCFEIWHVWSPKIPLHYRTNMIRNIP